MQNLASLAEFHRNYFRSGANLSAEWREGQLIALRCMMKEHAEEFYAALWADLRRHRIEADWVDVKCMTSEIDYVLTHLRQWMTAQFVSTPLMLTPCRAQVRFDPLGVALIIGTWNYPVMVTLSPLIAAISGGNTAVIKPSEVAAASAEVIARLIPEYMDRNAFSVILGGPREATILLEQHWDHIFYTGGERVAKLVMTAAAQRLTPVILELGGKNPTIVHSSANLRIAARRIVFGRYFNAGQTCTAPDYVLAFKDIAAEFLKHVKEALLQFYGEDPQKSPDYGRIVNLHHFDRLIRLLASGTIYQGGQHDRAERFLAPSVLVNVSPESTAMQEEIFGPILPVLEVSSVNEVIAFVNARPTPLALYLFSEDRSVTERILDATTSGGVVVNDCTLQPIIHGLPFGGVGSSGIGKYHGEFGFRAYTNARGVLDHSTLLDFGGVRYPPYEHKRKLREFVIPS